MVRASHGQDDGPIIIKKYANRRLYNTATSKYITLDYIGKLIRKNEEFQVIDAKTGGDITHNVLTQIIMDEEQGGKGVLPTSFLREIISFYGGSMHKMVPQYLEASMQAFRENRQHFEQAVEDAVGKVPFGGIAQRNLQMIKAARDALVPGRVPGTDKAQQRGEDIDALKQQLADLQAKLDRIDSDD